MKNLAGDKDADKYVREELRLAGIPMENEVSKGEVPYNTIGKINGWTFRRAWYYWMVSIPDSEKGLPLDIAMELHLRKNPTDDNEIMGNSIRVGGHCGCPSPVEYGAYPFYDEEGKPTVERYVRSYHVDDQISLNILAEVLKKYYHT